eukprot:7770951-Pyramimonas_sp.AAC.1
MGGLRIKVTWTTDAESVFKSLSRKGVYTLGTHQLDTTDDGARCRALCTVCDIRDMTADGHTKGGIDIYMLLQ